MTRIFYIGDSTVHFNRIDTHPQVGMSQVLNLYTTENVSVIHHGKNGHSTKSFRDEGLFEPVRLGLKQGDFLFIQFGHNDGKPDLPRHADAYGAFQDNLRYFIYEARKAGAHPVLITPTARRLFNADGMFCSGCHGDYPDAIRQVGEQERVPVADVTALSECYLSQLGDEASKPLFMGPADDTHFKYEGAVQMVGLLAKELERFGPPYADLLYQTGR